MSVWPSTDLSLCSVQTSIITVVSLNGSQHCEKDSVFKSLLWLLKVRYVQAGNKGDDVGLW